MANAKNGYVSEDTEGKLYRVRDQDRGKNEPVIVWGENLTHEEAHLLKERITGAEKSRSARLEEMSIAPPPTSVDPKGKPIEGRAPGAASSTTSSSEFEQAVDRAVAARMGSLVTADSPAHHNPAIQSARRAGLGAARGAAREAQARAQVVVPPPVPSNGEVDLPENIEDELEAIGSGDDLPA